MTLYSSTGNDSKLELHKTMSSTLATFTKFEVSITAVRFPINRIRHGTNGRTDERGATVQHLMRLPREGRVKLDD